MVVRQARRAFLILLERPPLRLPPSSTADAVCRCILALSLLLGAMHTAVEVRRLGRHQARAAGATLVAGRPSLSALGTPAGFEEFARRTIPPDASYRIMLPSRGAPDRAVACVRSVGAGLQFWLVYSLLPRIATCQPGVRWTVYAGVRPGPLPPGARAHVWRPDLVVVDSGGAP
jgi:hypothetical protein